VFYALFNGIFVYREITVARLRAALAKSVNDLGMIMLLMACVLSYGMTIERAPQEITKFVTSLSRCRGVILMLVVGSPLLSRMFSASAANILLITPIVVPVLTAAGVDPIHMGALVVFLINLGG
jgi:TRAP-type C4-dicarboxylate transport system permease large subunit